MRNHPDTYVDAAAIRAAFMDTTPTPTPTPVCQDCEICAGPDREWIYPWDR